MAEATPKRLQQAAKDLNIGMDRVVEALAKKGIQVENKPTTKLTGEQVASLEKEFAASAHDRQEAQKVIQAKRQSDLDAAPKFAAPAPRPAPVATPALAPKPAAPAVSVAVAPAPAAPVAPVAPVAVAPVPTPAPQAPSVPGLKVLGKIELDSRGRVVPPRPAASVPAAAAPAPTLAPAPAVVRVETPKVEAPVPPAPKVEVPAAPVPVAALAPAAQPVAKAEPAAPVPVAAAPAAPAVPATPLATSAAAATQAIPAEPTVMPEDTSTIVAKSDTLKGLTVLGKIDLSSINNDRRGPGGRGPRPIASSDVSKRGLPAGPGQKKRARLPGPAGSTTSPPSPGYQGNRPAGGGTGGGGYQGNRPGGGPGQGGQRPGGPGQRPGQPAPKPNAPALTPEQAEKQIQEQIRATLAKLGGNKGGNNQNRAKYRRDKRSMLAEDREALRAQNELDAKILKLTEFISANDLASLMDVNVNEVIKVCLGMGMFVSINQRLDAEAITVIADEFGFDVEFLSAEEEEIDVDAGDAEEDLKHRAPIVTIMGHVDHGKTSLLDYIRDASVAKGEAGGITQHIGAYEVRTKSGQPITFLDTPGHEAFTAMRARGAKVTDIAIIVVAADDSVMPQTKEAINHAQAAGVPIIIALNKIDKPSANPEKIREELSQINILVEEWGGKYQSQEVSAKSGIGIEDLLEKVLLEAELLDLKANPDRNAIGTVIEASLDKGRGYVTTVLVQTGTLNVGDIILAGPHFGRVKAMTDHRGKKMKTAPPATPVQVLGLTGAPQAGDRIQVMETEREAREIATQRLQLAREQTIRTKKHITLDEIGRRLAIGSFKELNILVKGDVDGSVEALSDSLLKLSTP